MGVLGDRALAKVSGPSWDGVREKFLQLSDALLSVGPNTFAELTTIYVKYSLSDAASSPVYAVVWIKNSKKWLIGMSLPEGSDHPLLLSAPPQKTYTGLTKYFYIGENDQLPDEITDWATLAFERVAGCQ